MNSLNVIYTILIEYSLTSLGYAVDFDPYHTCFCYDEYRIAVKETTISLKNAKAEPSAGDYILVYAFTHNSGY